MRLLYLFIGYGVVECIFWVVIGVLVFVRVVDGYGIEFFEFG